MGAKFEVFESADGDFCWHLKAADGGIIASGQGYKSKAAADKGIQSVKTNAPYAAVVHTQPARTSQDIAIDDWHDTAAESQRKLKEISNKRKGKAPEPTETPHEVAVRKQRVLKDKAEKLGKVKIV